ncbi:MAG: hypothetical protein PHI98_14985 [Eubacteriales bacterium]|nr:hypothetical protein [Eubacteriales bacterium]
MKKLLVLLICLSTFVSLLPLASSIAEGADTEIWYTDTFWDIPWEIPHNEFLAIVKRAKNLDFVSIPTPNDVLRYTLQNPEKFFFLNEPVRRFDVFFDLVFYFDTTADDPISHYDKKSNVDAFKELYIEFLPTVTTPSIDDYLDQFSRLIKELYTQYGDPEHTVMSVSYCDLNDPLNQIQKSRVGLFSVPVIFGVLQPETFLKAISDPYDFVVLRTIFHNRTLTLSYCPFEGVETCNIRLQVKNMMVTRSSYYFDGVYYTDFIPRPEKK